MKKKKEKKKKKQHMIKEVVLREPLKIFLTK